jgi:hypothetical protein
MSLSDETLLEKLVGTIVSRQVVCKLLDRAFKSTAYMNRPAAVNAARFLVRNGGKG